MSAYKPFAGIATFLKTPMMDATRQVPIIGVPFDGATSYRAGSRFGPEAIRRASKMLTDGEHPFFENDPATFMSDWGDMDLSNVDVAKSLNQITEAVKQIPHYEKGKPMLFMGGDHTITLGILRALYQKHGKMAVIHFDAHCDTWADHFGDPLGHGTWVRNAVEEGLVDPFCFTSIGLRSPVDKATKNWLSDRGGTSISAQKYHAFDKYERARFYTDLRCGLPTYVSFDIDCLDPAHAPGTGTPEIGGLTTMEIMEFFNDFPIQHWVGMDVVEVLPAHDVSDITALAAATVLWAFAARIGAGR